MNTTQLRETFVQYFGYAAQSVFFAPGRVNLIGEHIDYNGGHVFPCALDLGTYALARPRNDRQLNMLSLNFADQGVHTLDLQQIAYDSKNDWANYPAGIFYTIQEMCGVMPFGLDVLFYGNIPNGAGLSSSASIEMATAVMMKNIYQLAVSQIDLVKLAQRSENEFNDLNCGIMDMFASGMGRANQAMLLNTDTLMHQYVTLDFKERYQLLIANTNKRRDLNESNYNQRRNECDAALSDLKTLIKINHLCDLMVEQFELYQHVIKSPISLKRARHAVTENERTLQAADAVSQHDWIKFGQLMNASHLSLRNDFEVTGLHLDALVESAWMNGAIGARITGAGFGGCTVMLIEQHNSESFCQKVASQYNAQTGLTPSFYAVRIGDGARLLNDKASS